MRALVPVVITLALLGPAFAGCLSLTSRVAPLSVAPDAPLARLKLPVHVVLVGLPQGFVDPQGLAARLPAKIDPFNEQRAGVTGYAAPEPLAYDIDYQVTRAPDAFAQALFTYAGSIAKDAEPSAFLKSYDAGTTAHPHLCNDALGAATMGLVTRPDCKKVQQIPGDALEAWIAANRARYGVDHSGAVGYTLYVLDGYSNAYLPTDTYHSYAIDDKTSSSATLDQRAWGGDHDFVFFDVSAAPSSYDYRPWASYSIADGATGGQDIDAPIWDLAKSPDEFEKNLARNIGDAVHILWARNPIYVPEYSEKFDFPLTIFIDPNARMNPKSPLYGIAPADIKKMTRADRIQEALQGLLPRSTATSNAKFVFLPDDDAGMSAAVDDAKHRGSQTTIDFGVIKHYLRQNWNKYVPDAPGTRVYPEFVFWLEYPSTSFYAYSDADEWGDSWGVFTNVADLSLCPTALLAQHLPACLRGDRPTPEAFSTIYSEVLLHELGHSLSLTHTHDTGHWDTQGYATYDINWLWDSTSSSMTYRHSRLSFDQFDRDFLARAQTGWVAKEVLTQDPSNKGAQDALTRLARGETVSALDAALDARKATLATAAPMIVPAPLAPPAVADITVPASITLVGEPPYVGGIPFFAPNPLAIIGPDAEGVTHASLDVKLPAGTKRLEVKFEETNPTNALRTSFLAVTTKEGKYVGGAYNNGYDTTQLNDVWRCNGECVVTLYQYSGVAGTYKVTTTPFASQERPR